MTLPPSTSPKTDTEMIRPVMGCGARAVKSLRDCFFGVLCRPGAALSMSKRNLYSDGLRWKHALFKTLSKTLPSPQLLGVGLFWFPSC